MNFVFKISISYIQLRWLTVIPKPHKVVVLTFVIFGAQLTGVPPALSWHFTTAAFGLGGVESFGYRALSIFKVCEAETLAGI